MKKIFGFKKLTVEAKAAAVYTFSSLFTKGLGMISVPIFTRLMTTDEIGVINLYNSWDSLLSVFATLALTSGGYMVALKEFEGERDQYQSSVLTLTSLTGLVIMGIYLLAPAFWSQVLGLSQAMLGLMMTGFVLGSSTGFWLARQRYEYRYNLSACLSIGSALLATGAAVAAVIVLSGRNSLYVAEGRMYAHHFVTYTMALILWIYTMYKGRTFFSWRYWKFSLGLSLPLIVNSFASKILGQSDRVMIDAFVGKSAVGIYSTLYTVSNLSTIVWGAINSSFIPYLYQNLGTEEGCKGIKKISLQLLAAYAAVCVLLTFFAPEIVRILATEEYYEAIYIMPPIAAGIFFISVANMGSNVLLFYKKSVYITIATMVGAVLNIVLNAIFIPRYGYMAAAYTTLIGYIIMAEMQTIVSNRIFRQQSGRNETVYASTKIRLIEVATVGCCMSGMLLYDFFLLRYCVAALVIVVMAVVWKKREWVGK